MPALAVTLATQSIYRGIATGLLGEHACTQYPEGFGYFGQDFIPGTIVPFAFVLYLVLMLGFFFVLHKTAYGRRLYAIGNSAETARFSGINVQRTRILNYTLTGMFCGIAAVLLASRILSVRSNIATGWDLEIITLVVLGGVAITGGRGSVFGVFIGSLLITAVLLPRLLDIYKANRKLKMQQGGH